MRESKALLQALNLNTAGEGIDLLRRSFKVWCLLRALFIQLAVPAVLTRSVFHPLLVGGYIAKSPYCTGFEEYMAAGDFEP